MQIHAGEDRGSSSWAWICVGVVVAILGAQSIYHGTVAKEAKFLDNLNDSMSDFHKDYKVTRDQNIARTAKIWGTSYTDEELRKLNISNRTRKVVALNRDKDRNDGSYKDFEQTVLIIKQKKEEKKAQQPSNWSWWPFGKKS